MRETPAVLTDSVKVLLPHPVSRWLYFTNALNAAPIPLRRIIVIIRPFPVRDGRRRRLSINEVATYRDIALTRGHAGRALGRARRALKMGAVEAARLVDIMRQVCKSDVAHKLVLLSYCCTAWPGTAVYKCRTDANVHGLLLIAPVNEGRQPSLPPALLHLKWKASDRPRLSCPLKWVDYYCSLDDGYQQQQQAYPLMFPIWIQQCSPFLCFFQTALSTKDHGEDYVSLPQHSHDHSTRPTCSSSVAFYLRPVTQG